MAKGKATKKSSRRQPTPSEEGRVETMEETPQGMLGPHKEAGPSQAMNTRVTRSTTQAERTWRIPPIPARPAWEALEHLDHQVRAMEQSNQQDDAQSQPPAGDRTLIRHLQARVLQLKQERSLRQTHGPTTASGHSQPDNKAPMPWDQGSFRHSAPLNNPQASEPLENQELVVEVPNAHGPLNPDIVQQPWPWIFIKPHFPNPYNGTTDLQSHLNFYLSAMQCAGCNAPISRVSL